MQHDAGDAVSRAKITCWLLDEFRHYRAREWTWKMRHITVVIIVLFDSTEASNVQSPLRHETSRRRLQSADSIGHALDFACIAPPSDAAPTAYNQFFSGAAAAPFNSDLVVFAPDTSNCVGLFNASTSTFGCFGIDATTGETPTTANKFAGAVADPTTERVIFAPSKTDCVGVFDQRGPSFTCLYIPRSTPDLCNDCFRFAGALVDPTTGLFVFVPRAADCIGVFNATNSSETFACITMSPIVTPGRWGINKFSGGVFALVGRVSSTSSAIIFVPYNADCIGVLERNEFTCVDISGHEASTGAVNKFSGAVVDPNTGLVIFAPNDADCVGTFDAATSIFACIDISATLTRNKKFRGAIVDPNTGLIIFVPSNADCVGIFNANSSTFACVDISAILPSNYKFDGAAVDPTTGLVVFAPKDAVCVGTFSVTACDSITPCSVGYYRTNCGASDSGQLSAAEARSIGSCRACTTAASGEYYTDHGGLTDACPTNLCSSLSACPESATRVECGGFSEGFCSACPLSLLTNLTDSFFNMSEPEACTPGACADLPECPVGECTRHTPQTTCAPFHPPCL